MSGHGLTIGQPFFVVQMFDHEGYHSSCVDHSYHGVLAKAAIRSARMTATSVPFPGAWDGSIPDVSDPNPVQSRPIAPTVPRTL